MAFDVAGNGIFRPLPILESLGKKFELARWRRKSNAGLPVYFHAERGSILDNHIGIGISRRVGEIGGFNAGFVDFINVVLD